MNAAAAIRTEPSLKEAERTLASLEGLAVALEDNAAMIRTLLRSRNSVAKAFRQAADAEKARLCTIAQANAAELERLLFARCALLESFVRLRARGM